MASTANRTAMDWVKLHYVNIENSRGKPVTIHVPQDVLDKYPDPPAQPTPRPMVVMMSKIRRTFDEARTQGQARFARNRHKGR